MISIAMELKPEGRLLLQYCYQPSQIAWGNSRLFLLRFARIAYRRSECRRKIDGLLHTTSSIMKMWTRSHASWSPKKLPTMQTKNGWTPNTNSNNDNFAKRIENTNTLTHWLLRCDLSASREKKQTHKQKFNQIRQFMILSFPVCHIVCVWAPFPLFIFSLSFFSLFSLCNDAICTN